jgi:hypothetical protein
MANTIAKMRENTWNGVLPGDNNGFDSVPFNRKNTGTEPINAKGISRAGIKVSDIDLVGPIGRKAALKKAQAADPTVGINVAPDYTNTNYPEEAVVIDTSTI